MTEYENFELRSEKVRNIIGRVPSASVMGGASYIAFLLFALLIATVLIPYPENIHTGVIITDKDRRHIYAETLIPYQYITQIKKGTDIYIEFEGRPTLKYGRNSGIIQATEDSLIQRNGNSYFRAYLVLDTPLKYNVYKNMKGTATLTLANNSFLLYLLGQ